MDAKLIALGLVLLALAAAAYTSLRAVDERSYADASTPQEIRSGGRVHLRFDLEGELCTTRSLDYLSIPVPRSYGITVFLDQAVPFYYPRYYLEYCLEAGKAVEVYGAYDKGADQVVAHKLVYDGGARVIVPDTPLATFAGLFLGTGGALCLVLGAAPRPVQGPAGEGPVQAPGQR
jgi:hypothetical protein